LVEIPIKAGCPECGVVLDPFMGTGTVAAVAKRLGRHYLGFEISQEYIKIINDRLGI
jgi:site-specific DNA-methyltransferase (adenine-specific)